MHAGALRADSDRLRRSETQDPDTQKGDRDVLECQCRPARFVIVPVQRLRYEHSLLSFIGLHREDGLPESLSVALVLTLQ